MVTIYVLGGEAFRVGVLLVYLSTLDFVLCAAGPQGISYDQAVVEINDSVRLLEKDEPILFARDLTLGMYDLFGDDEDPGGGSPPHGGGGGGGPVGEGGDGGEARGEEGDGGEAGGEQPGAGDGEAGDGGEQPPEGGASVPGGGGGGLHLDVRWFLGFPMPVSIPAQL